MTKLNLLLGGLMCASLSVAAASDLTIDGNLRVNGNITAFNPNAASSSGNEVLSMGAFYNEALAGSGGYLSFRDVHNTAVGRIRSILEADAQMGLSFSTFNFGLSEKLRISSAGNIGIGLSTPRVKLEIARMPVSHGVSLPNSSTVLGRSVVDWHYEQGNDGNTYYIKLADVSPTHGSIQVEGLIGGHTFNDGKATVNLLVAERDNPIRSAMVMGNLGAQNIKVYKNANNSSSIYLVTTSWTEVTLRITASCTTDANGTILYPNPSRTTTVPSGTLVYTLSQNVQYTFGYDGKIKFAKQGDIRMGEFGNGTD